MAAVTVCSDFGAHSCPYKKKHHRSRSLFLYHVGTVRRWLSASPGGFSQIPTHTGLQNSSSSIIEQVAESRGWDSAWLLPCTEGQAARTPSHLSHSLWARSYIRFSVPVLAKDKPPHCHKKGPSSCKAQELKKMESGNLGHFKELSLTTIKLIPSKENI